MTLRHIANDSVHWFMGELTSRIIAESGIPSDRFHLGKIILQSFKDAPDFILQIDGATGVSETYGSALERTVRCATCFKNLGLGHGDVVILMAPNHLDVAIPLYAALYLGIIVAAVDRTLTTRLVQHVIGFRAGLLDTENLEWAVSSGTADSEGLEQTDSLFTEDTEGLEEADCFGPAGIEDSE